MCARISTAHTTSPPHLGTFNADGSRITPSTSSHHDSHKLLPKHHDDDDDDEAHDDAPPPPRPLPSSRQQDTELPHAITPHRLRSQLLVHNLKASGILPYGHGHGDGDDGGMRHSARWLEAIGFDENASMYSRAKRDGERERERREVGGGGMRRKKRGEGKRERGFFWSWGRLVGGGSGNGNGNGNGKGEKL